MKSLYITFVFSVFFLKSFTLNQTFDELSNGVHIKEKVSFFTQSIYNENEKQVNVLSDLSKSKYHLVVTGSPYVCGGLEKSDIKLLNELSLLYQGHVIYLISDFYHEESMIALRQSFVDPNVRILFDYDEENISKIVTDKENLLPVGYFIVSSKNEIKYAYIKSYSVVLDSARNEEIKRIIRSYLDENTK